MKVKDSNQIRRIDKDHASLIDQLQHQRFDAIFNTMMSRKILKDDSLFVNLVSHLTKGTILDSYLGDTWYEFYVRVKKGADIYYLYLANFTNHPNIEKLLMYMGYKAGDNISANVVDIIKHAVIVKDEWIHSGCNGLFDHVHIFDIGLNEQFVNPTLKMIICFLRDADYQWQYQIAFVERSKTTNYRADKLVETIYNKMERN
jgi:hypothetical protein